MNVKIESNTKSAVRTAVVTGRCCEEREKLLNPQSPRPTGSLVFVFEPTSTTVGGHGQVFENFRQTGQLEGFPGQGTHIASMFDANFNKAPLKLMRFDETYKKLRHDVSYSECKHSQGPFTLSVTIAERTYLIKILYAALCIKAILLTFNFMLIVLIISLCIRV